MSKGKIAFFSVIFPSNMPYFAHFLDSLAKQNYSSFDLFLINDGVNIDLLNETVAQFPELCVIVYPLTGTIAQIRNKGIQKLVSLGHYEYVIFGDTDDYFSENRILNSVILLEKYDIVVSDLSLVNENNELLIEKYFSARLSNAFTFDYRFIVDKNMVGLGNTAIHAHLLKNKEVSELTKMVDWELFSLIMMENDKLEGVFDNTMQVFYRQHSQNMAGIGEISLAKIENARKVKLTHYESLKQAFKTNEEIFNLLNQKIFMYQDSQNIEMDISLVQNYVKSRPFWWEEAIIKQNEITIG